jgi:flagellar biosynthesis protein FlhA
MAAVKRVAGNGWQQRGDVLVAVFVCAAILMLLIPLPAVLLDLCMLFNLCLSLLVILIVLYARNTLEFTVFPTLLLLVTVFGLALNVSSTRLILAQGADFDGRIVRAFGSFVVGASGVAGYLIGLIIFTIIIAVQFVVITKGSTRVAEVAARFTLDALPGRQMAIDAEYHAGLLTDVAAQRRKQELQRQSDFYGAMDGASKFVSGSVRVAILITLINLAGGLIMGVSVHGEPLAVAARTYVSLTIGDGLVTQLPALLISTATGIVVTRAISGASFGRDVVRQFSHYDRPFYITGGFLAVLALLPGFPPHLLLPLAAAVAALGYAVGRAPTGAGALPPAPGDGRPAAAADRPGAVDAGTAVAPGARAGAASAAATATTAAVAVAPPEPLSLELGYGLVALTEGELGADLLDRIAGLRAQMAGEWGVPVPHIRITDNLRLAPAGYVLKIRGMEVGSGRGRAGGAAALIAHVGELLGRRAAELLGREQVRSLLDGLRADYPTTVEEATGTLPVGEIRRVLQGLLAEQVSIRDLPAILETLADWAPVNRDTSFLVQQVRHTLARQISLQHAGADGVLRVITLAREWERQLLAAGDTVTGMESDRQRRWIDALSSTLAQVTKQGCRPALLSSAEVRGQVRESTRREIPHLVCLATTEVVPEVVVESLAEVRLGVGP